MSQLTFTLKRAPDLRVDLSPLTPDALAGKSRAEIAAIPLTSGNRKIKLEELFETSGDDTTNIVIENSCSKLDYVGHGMTSGGTLLVRGDAGAYTGFRMVGGTLTVEGDAGAFAACGMKGGLLHIIGNAGDFLGAALAGFRHGMAGGTVIVTGRAGDRAGDHMRRGAILIEGDCGDYCASRMLAGTIAVLGRTGNHTGFGMKRGTLVLWRSPDLLSVLFSDCGTHNLSYLTLLTRSWRDFPGKFAQLETRQRVRRYVGDNANGGKGEILIWQ